MNRAVVLSNLRRVERDEVFHRTTVSIEGRAPARALMVDISPLGCMIRCEAEADRSQRITIALPGMGDVEGVVAWAIMGRIGIEFTHPVSGDAYDSLTLIVKTP
jgi:hypothetical protein